MAGVDVTTNPRVTSEEFLHASGHAHADAKSDGEETRDFLSVIEEALEEERSLLMVANSILGCLQAALDPEAINIVPPIYFPEVLEQARRLIDDSIRRLEYGEIRRLLRGGMGGAN